MNIHLPKLSKSILPSFLSLRKGVKIFPEGIHLQHEFRAVEIDQQALNKYVDFIGFSGKIPLTYLYILAQRAQVALMLRKDFSIAIPGMVHLVNKLKLQREVDFDQPFDLKATVDVDYKKTGSLIPVFRVDYFQNGIQVVSCESVYLARRKKASRQLKKRKIAAKLNFEVFETWDLHQKLGKQYAKASGDRNPIHTSRLFAKIMGFKQPIAHGWYTVSRIVKSLADWKGNAPKMVEVAFKSPVFLPSTQQLEVDTINEREFVFLLRAVQNQKITLTGKLGF